MALWGKTDTLAGKPKYVARIAYFDATATSVSTSGNTISLVSANTGFSTGDEVVYNRNSGTAIGGLTSGSTYYVRATAAGVIALYDTQAHAIAGGATGLVDITSVGTGKQILQRTGAANVNDHTNNGAAIYFADITEARQAENRARGIKSPGWWLYKSWTNADGSVQKQAELLVAMQGADSDVTAANAGDASDDAVLVDRTITISVQPASRSVVTPNTAIFSVTAAASPTASLSYQWQVQQSGTGAWADVATGSGGTTASFTTGATAVTAGSGDTNGDKYRVIVSASGATSVTSNAATLTVTAS